MLNKNLLITIIAVCSVLIFGGTAIAQTVLISPTGDGGFETGSTFAANGWTEVNGYNNMWYVGNAPVVYAGSNCAFTGSNSTTWNGEAFVNVNHFYRDVTFPAGPQANQLNFYYKVINPDATYDMLKVYLVPTTTIPVAGTQLSSGQIGTAYDAATTWTLVTINLTGITPGSIQRLVFSWNTDGASPHAAVAVDYISLVSTPLNPLIGGNSYPINGTENPPTSFASITSAAAFLALNGVAGTGQVNLQLSTGYAGEPGPVTIGPIPGTSASLGVTFCPALGYTATTSIAGLASPNQFAIALNGCQYVTLDGRAGGVGSNRDWTIICTGTPNGMSAIRFLNSNGSTNNNAVRYCVIQAEATGTATGIIDMTTGTSPNLYQNNIIENNIIESGAAGIRGYGVNFGWTSAGLANTLNVLRYNLIRRFNDNGVRIIGTVPGLEVYGNEIYFTAAQTTGTSLTGIYFSSTTSNTFGGVKIYNNKIYDLLTTSVSVTIRGFYQFSSMFTGDPVQFYNNFIALGNSVTTNPTIYGIDINTSSSGTPTQIYFNSVYISGSATAGASNSMAFRRSLADLVLVVRNNVFYNTRSNAGGTGTHWAIGINTTSVGLINNNDYFADGTGGVLGTTTNAVGGNQATLTAWKTAIPTDDKSISQNPNYVNPTASPPDLHVNSAIATSLESGGYPIAGITTDIDGNTRAAGYFLIPPYPNTAPDIGADEFNGTVIDVTSPNISYIPLANTPFTSNRTLKARIADPVSFIDNDPGDAPRLWWKKGAAGVWQFNEQTTVVADSWIFTFDFTLVSGVTANDTIFYYVAAQDSSGNTATNPPGGFGNTPPGSTPPPAAMLNYFRILLAFAGDYNIGVGQTYTSLNTFFTAINSGTVTGNVRGLIVSDITEPASASLNPLNYIGGPWSIRIIPSGSARVISASIAGALVEMNGADYVTFDGDLTGTKSLTFRNTSISGQDFVFRNDASYDTVKNCIIEGVNTSSTSGLVLFSTSIAPFGGVTGNRNIVILNNNIRDRSDATGVPYNGIYSSGTAAATNGQNTISGNNIFNFSYHGIYFSSTGFGNDWVITGNHIYEMTVTPTVTQYAIYIGTGSGHSIYGNYIGGSAPFCGGTPWTNTGAVAFYGIYWYNSGAAAGNPVYVRKNTIQNISYTSASAGVCYPIYVYYPASVVYVDSNTVGHNTNPNSIVNNGSSATRGIYVYNNYATGTCYINDNLIANIEAAGIGTAVTINGIYLYNNSSNDNTIARNVIHDLGTSSTMAPTGVPGSACGIGSWPASWYSVSITDNTIYEISCRNTGTAATWACGMSLTNLWALVANNRIYGIHNASTGTTVTAPPQAMGIYFRATSNAFFVNNMISVGSDPADNTNTVFAGMRNGAGTVNYTYLYFNSILVSGTAVSGALPSFGFVRGDNSGTAITTTITSRNNILVNRRTGGTGKHYAIANQNNSADSTGWGVNAFNNNVLYTTNPTTLGLWGTTDLDFAGWRAGPPTGTGGDANSINGNPIFLSNTDLHISASSNVPNRGGIPIGGITVDIDGQTRSTTFPDIGADEYTPTGPVAFNLISPTNGATGQPLSGQLIWNTAVGANRYDVYLDQNNPPTTKVSEMQKDTFYNYSGLSGSSTYRWYVVAWNDTLPHDPASITSATWSFSTISPPSAPTNLLLSSITSSSMTLNWTDNSPNEDSFIIRRDINPGGTFPRVGMVLSNITTYTDASLSPNIHYYYRVTACNTQGESNFAVKDSWTLAETPGQPVLSNAMYLTMNFVLTPGANSAQTQFVVRVNYPGFDSKDKVSGLELQNTSSGLDATKYLNDSKNEPSDLVSQNTSYDLDATRYLDYATGTLVASEVWGTYAQFGGASGIKVKDLRPGLTYTYDVKARNGANPPVQTPYGPSAVLATLAPLTMPLSESFQTAGFPPFGWDSLTVLAGLGVRPQFSKVSAGTSPICSPYDGDSMVKFNSYSAQAGTQARLWTPPINLTGVTQIVLNFYMYNYTAGYDSLAIDITDNFGSTWLELTKYPLNTGTAGWSAKTVSLNSYAGDTVMIGFRGCSRYGYNIFFDLVTVQAYRDVAVTTISRPNLIETKRTQFQPQVTVTNNGGQTENIPVVAEIWTTGTMTAIGTATTNSYSGPINRFYNYSGHEAIYLASEINQSGNINRIAYYKESGSDMTPIDSVRIYMKHTTATTIATGNWDTTGMTRVFFGQFTNNATSGWMEVTLTTPFAYNGTNNLQILILKDFQPYISTTICPYWRYTATTDYMTRQAASDVSLPLSLTQTYNRPNINVVFQPPVIIYADTVIVNGVTQGSSAPANFWYWTADPEGSYLFKSYTILPGDLVPGNNLMTRNFTVELIPLTLSTPSDGALLNDNTPYFSWSTVTGAATYRIQVDNNNNFSSPEINTTVSVANYTPVSALPDTTYFWRVRVETPGTPDPYSSVRSFTIDATVPIAPNLIQPANNAINVSLTPTFEWTLVTFSISKNPDAISIEETDASTVRYRIQVSTDPLFSTTVLDDSTTATTLICPITLDSVTTYYWHVRAADEAGNVGNYSLTFNFTTVAPSGPSGNWEAMVPVPSAPSGKNPKSGSCMAGLEATDLIYFLKASNRPDFYSYDPATNVWTALETIPKGEKGADYADGKYPKRGAAMAAYEAGKCLFVVRGNNRLGFWKYQADTLGAGDTIGWKKMATILVGTKRCKYGTGLTHVTKGGKDYLFLLKGAKTSEVYLYDIETNTWSEITSPPVGLSGKTGYKKGSCVAYDGSEYVYVLQGYYGSFFKYRVEADSWYQLKQYNYKEMVNREGRKKKPKDGAALVYYNNGVYMLKGGNTYEVWRYDVMADEWTQMPAEWDIPTGANNKKVKDGGGMIKFGDYFWASKGKNTPEFYRHNLLTDAAAFISYQPTNEGTMENKVEASSFKLTIAPNPAINVSTIRYTLPVPGPVSINLYDVTGTLVKSYTNTNPTKNGVLTLDAKALPAGVYMLRFNSGEIKVTRKLVLEK